jgi:cytochrome c peroxidase
MKCRRIRIVVSLLVALAAIMIAARARTQEAGIGPGDGLVVTFDDSELRRILSHSPLPDPPVDPTNRYADDPAAARLGQFLFFDERLSSNGSFSCSTCHDPAQGFSDGKTFGEAIGTTDRHTQSLFNVAQNRWFFWDGRADSLWMQALEPIEKPNELGSSRLQIAHLVHDDPELRTAYESIFGPMPELADEERFPPEGRPMPDEPEHPHHIAYASMHEADRDAVDRVFANVGKAIEAYERRLVTRRSAFDVFVEGLRSGNREKIESLSPQAQRGLKLFIGRANCRLCHAGPNFTDGEFHNNGTPPLDGGQPRDDGRYGGAKLVKNNPFNAFGRFSDDPDSSKADQTRSLLRSPEQWGQFKTPTLRNVALSPPYMHQGQFTTLEAVIRHYSTLDGAFLASHHQEQLLKPLELTDREIADLAAFLGSLTGEPLDQALLRRPDSPRLSVDGAS